MTEEAKKVSAEECRCVRCGDCGGGGTIYLDWRGNYLGSHRSDDMDEPEPCEQCGGSGIVETCSRCQLLEDMDRAEDY